MIAKLKDNLDLWGLSPAKLAGRLAGGNAPKILTNSIPKSGTHLLERLLYLLPGISRQIAGTFWEPDLGRFDRRCAALRRGQFMVTHLHYHEERLRIIEKHGIRPILMIRDPRDVVISNANYITRGNVKHRLHKYFVNDLKTDKERLHYLIRGCADPRAHEYSIAEVMGQYYPWMQSGQVLTIRFRDLVGGQGGGSTQKQADNLELILDFLGLQIEAGDKALLMEKIYHPRSKTFHKGRIDQWRDRFDEEDKQLFKEVAGDWLVKFGYEKDLNW